MDLRFVLRRIALGLPLVVLPVGAGVLVTSTGCLCGTCPQGEFRNRVLTPAEESALASDTTGMVCHDLCEATADGGLPADSGSLDAGPARRVRNWVCTRGSGTLQCQEHISCGVGRAPRGWIPRARPVTPGSLAAHLAEVAQLEALAVPAFAELTRDLGLHGAPSSLVARARRSEREEREHARLTRWLAEHAGAEVAEVSHAPTPEPPALHEVAADNAFEGCVREAYGAIELAHRAAHAQVPALRRAFGAIARDEARHALLSLDVHEWARDVLGSSAARRIDERRERGLEALRESVSHEPAPGLARAAGLPSATRARDLVELLARAA